MKRPKGIGSDSDYDADGRLKIGHDGSLPPGIKAELERYLASTPEMVFDLSSPAPWEKHNMDRTDMGWRMGAGEEYLCRFCDWFAALSEVDRDRYQSAHPEPEGWTGFYGDL